MSIEYRVLKPGDEAALAAFVLPRIASSMFLLGNMRMSGLVDKGKPYTGTYAAAFDGDDIVGAAGHFWNGNLIVQSPLEYLYDLWQTAVSASKRSINGILGPAEQVAFVFTFLQIEPDLVKVDEVEYLYSLDLADLVVPDALQNGRLQGHRALPEDLDILTQWRVGFMVEMMNEADSPSLRERVRSVTQRYIDERRVWLLIEDETPVSMTAFNTAAAEAVQVGGVYTPPVQRSKGYARAAVAASLLDARDEGAQIGVLFTGIDNYPAQKAYEALGFDRVGDFRALLLKRPFDPG
jgi:predicted GNAT family acetyltransferase